jgi:hypothetical protein
MRFEFCIRCSHEKMCDECKVRYQLHEEVNNLPIESLDFEIVELASLSVRTEPQRVKLRYLHRRYKTIFSRDHVTHVSYEMNKRLQAVCAPAIG